MNSQHAPDFSLKNPEGLCKYLEEFEELAEWNGLTTKQKAKLLVKYVDKEMHAFWKWLEGYSQDYEILKQEILKAYSKLLLDNKSIIIHLCKLV